MNGVLMIRILGGGVALLSVVCKGTAQCAGVITPAAGVLFTTDWAIPGVTIAFSGLADPRTRWFLSGKVTGGTIRVACGNAEAGRM